MFAKQERSSKLSFFGKNTQVLNKVLQDSDLYLLISVDLPVAKDDSVNNSDTPKGFSRLLKFREMATKRQQEKREAKKNTNNESIPSTVRSLRR